MGAEGAVDLGALTTGAAGGTTPVGGAAGLAGAVVMVGAGGLPAGVGTAGAGGVAGFAAVGAGVVRTAGFAAGAAVAGAPGAEVAGLAARGWAAPLGALPGFADFPGFGALSFAPSPKKVQPFFGLAPDGIPGAGTPPAGGCAAG